MFSHPVTYSHLKLFFCFHESSKNYNQNVTPCIYGDKHNSVSSHNMTQYYTDFRFLLYLAYTSFTVTTVTEPKRLISIHRHYKSIYCKQWIHFSVDHKHSDDFVLVELEPLGPIKLKS